MICFKSETGYSIYMPKHIFINVFHTFFFRSKPYHRCPYMSVVWIQIIPSYQEYPTSNRSIFLVLSKLEASQDLLGESIEV